MNNPFSEFISPLYEDDFLGKVDAYEPMASDLIYRQRVHFDYIIDCAKSLELDNIALNKDNSISDEEAIAKAVKDSIVELLRIISIRLSDKFSDNKFESFLYHPDGSIHESYSYFLKTANNIYITLSILFDKWDARIIAYTFTREKND